jgi:hypothetical protein
MYRYIIPRTILYNDPIGKKRNYTKVGKKKLRLGNVSLYISLWVLILATSSLSSNALSLS